MTSAATARTPERADGAPGAAPLDPAHVAALLDLSADAIITVSPDEHVTSWNRGAREMFGYAAEEVVGQPFMMLLPDEENARGEIQWIHETTIARGAIRDYETRRRRKDGAIIEVSLTRTVVRDTDGTVVGFTAILRDITYRKRLERQILSAERLATAGQVSAGVAHEIGAPLTAIAMTVEHMLRQRCQTCAGADQMRILQSQTDRLSRLARQLVDLAKPAAHSPGPVSLADVAASSAALLRSQFAQRGARIVVDVPAATPTIRGDGAHLQQVLLNLLFNSLRVIPEGRGEVVIAAHAEEGVVVVTVTDNGPGIAADDLPHLFRPFFSRSGSTGLGLALAAQIVQAHRGTIDAASPPGRGAAFTITLPAPTTDG